MFYAFEDPFGKPTWVNGDKVLHVKVDPESDQYSRLTMCEGVEVAVKGGPGEVGKRLNGKSATPPPTAEQYRRAIG
ncbi:hypothetical protein [Rhodospirillum sp. A1_3_36]|uniref:hypothetical protein n=1 Tax=Rhodospirillum sp. A1_3_36 TaxID=3391666 RepID=UPI0039A4079E